MIFNKFLCSGNLTLDYGEKRVFEYLVYRLYCARGEPLLSRSTIEGGGDVTYLSPFWEGTARKQPLPGTYLTNPLVK